MGYISPAPHKTGAGICNLLTKQAHNRASGFFTCDASPHLFRIMAGRTGEPKGSPGSCLAGIANPVRLATPRFATLGGELSQLTKQGYPSWQTVNNAAIRSRASIPRPKSTAVCIVLIRSHITLVPSCSPCQLTACRYGFQPFWTTSPTISATFSGCLISHRAQRNASPIRPCSSGASVHPVNREVWL
ncbi:ash family protein [Salmonella enterica subsp. enterica serovar Rubislaw]|nr:ash family protein [Salmonella enterica subsp. enterica serovar Rubislaw]